MPVRRNDDAQYTLATNASTTGAGIQISGGEYFFAAEGTAGGATVSLQVKTPSGGWVDVAIYDATPVKFTTLPASQTSIALPAGAVRMAVTGGAPSGLNAWLVGLG